jgi:hypothetical protein
MLQTNLKKSLLTWAVLVILCSLGSFVASAPLPYPQQARANTPSQPVPISNELLDPVPYVDRGLLPCLQTTFLSTREAGDEFVELFRRKSLGQKIRDHFKSLGHKIRDHFKHFKEKAKAFFHKVGQGAKRFFHKVKEGFQTVGIKIAKFAVKAISVVHTYVGKVVGLVCKPLGKAIGLAADAEGKLADKLNNMDHHQSAKERKAFHGMDIAEHPMEYLAKKMEAKAAGKGKAAAGAAKAGGTILKALF